MSDDSPRQRAADILWECWRDGKRLAALPEPIRPTTRAEGYAIQALLERRSRAPLFGWKIAATSDAGQAHIGVDGPLAGRLLRERALGDNAVVPFGANHMRVAEAEFAFRMARDLRPQPEPYSVEAVAAAAGTLHPAIEIPDSRYDDFITAGGPQLIADNACAHLFVLGAATHAPWRDMDLAAHAMQARAGTAAREGSGANVLGGPLIALAWLANELSRLGITLRAGAVVTTGTCVTPMPVAPGDAMHVDFGAIGTVAARIGDR